MKLDGVVWCEGVLVFVFGFVLFGVVGMCFVLDDFVGVFVFVVEFVVLVFFVCSYFGEDDDVSLIWIVVVGVFVVLLIVVGVVNVDWICFVFFLVVLVGFVLVMFWWIFMGCLELFECGGSFEDFIWVRGYVVCWLVVVVSVVGFVGVFCIDFVSGGFGFGMVLVAVVLVGCVRGVL